MGADQSRRTRRRPTMSGRARLVVGGVARLLCNDRDLGALSSCLRHSGVTRSFWPWSRSRFFNLGDASPKWGYELTFGGRELELSIINISFILSKSFYFPGLKCYIVQFQAHIFILTWADAIEKIIVNVHGFSVLHQNFNRGDITFLTKKFRGHGKKSWKTRAQMEPLPFSWFNSTKVIKSNWLIDCWIIPQ